MSSLACCGGCIDDGVPSGCIERIADIDCYIAGSTSISKTAIIIASDIFGYTLPNTRLLAYSFAKDANAPLVVVPDMFDGSEPPAEMIAWMDDARDSNASYVSRAVNAAYILSYVPGFLWRNPIRRGVDRIEAVINALRNGPRSITRVGIMGYCWGGGVAVHLGARPDIVDCICSAHPGMLSLPSDINALVKPCLFILSEIDDHIGPTQMQLIKDSLSSNTIVSKVNVYPGVKHGFAVRGDEHDPHVKQQRIAAFNDAVEFLNANLPYP